MAESEAPAGTHLAHTMWGEPKSDTSIQAAHGNVQPSPFGVPYIEPPTTAELRAKKCRANDDTCNGWRVRDSEFCAGHAGLLPPGGKREP